MDASRFNLLVRAMGATPSRRMISRALAGLALGGGLSALLGTSAIESKKRRKKKKCKKSQKKCGKKCVPKDDCCPSCTGGRVCVDDVCECPEQECGGACIPADACCPACSSREICSFGFCVCAPGTIPCGEFCCVDGAEVCYTVSGQAPRCLPTG
jgi:hypothetical protein